MPTATKIDGFLKVPDIKGPSTRDGHEDEIEIHGVDYKMIAPYDPNSISRRGRVNMGMIKFTKHYDKSSPYLKKALFDNKALDEVVFSARRTIDGESKDYLVITLNDAFVMEYDMSQAEDEEDLIQEEVSFAYKKIKFVYDGNDEAEMDVYVGK
ncbi:Hcp family type VI secretion system effector [Mesorhizobium sp. M0621]|uniref:Hcp family type VI secretion system effector n=1 Tax=Mesorhizobium sp. M0621 TaxID=2956974 RepID=UPI00333B1260